jgi:hypothetical protein
MTALGSTIVGRPLSVWLSCGRFVLGVQSCAPAHPRRLLGPRTWPRRSASRRGGGGSARPVAPAPSALVGRVDRRVQLHATRRVLRGIFATLRRPQRSLSPKSKTESAGVDQQSAPRHERTSERALPIDSSTARAIDPERRSKRHRQCSELGMRGPRAENRGLVALPHRPYLAAPQGML